MAIARRKEIVQCAVYSSEKSDDEKEKRERCEVGDWGRGVRFQETNEKRKR